VVLLHDDDDVVELRRGGCRGTGGRQNAEAKRDGTDQDADTTGNAACEHGSLLTDHVVGNYGP